ncbi:MAG: hypothetical protein N3D78_02460, partial [Candidatus Aenigmarchaeota archaeon]|nr:hypothetical protein [Candidatus Aenigmarchaeota archaeon]
MKGDITFFTVVEGLLVVGIVAYLVYLTVYARMIVQTIVEEENRERNALNFANALISHEKIVYEKEGVRYRGILNASKLDKLFHKSNDGLRNPEEFKNVILNPLHKSGKLSREQIDLGYSQTVNIIHIIDFDRCNERECVVWSGVI